MQLEKLVREGKLNELKDLLRTNKTHVRDIEEIIYKIRAEDFKEFYDGKIDVLEFDRRMRALNYVLDAINAEFHDFSDKFKTITLPRGEFIYS